MKFKCYPYWVADSWLAALINCDYSGLEDHEIKALDEFEADVIRTHGFGHWSVNGEEQGEFERDEVTGLRANCYTIEWCARV